VGELGSWPLAGFCSIVPMRYAHSVIFMLLDDESGTAQVIAWPTVKAHLQQPLIRVRPLAMSFP
jgi:hypothetical protein